MRTDTPAIGSIAIDLDYLIFDTTDDATGACSFDAMASVMPARVPALLREVDAVLGWAWREFGAPSASGDESVWDFDLQAADDASASLPITFDGAQARLALPPHILGRVTITVTVSGSGVFSEAFRDRFPD